MKFEFYSIIQKIVISLVNDMNLKQNLFQLDSKFCPLPKKLKTAELVGIPMI